jgi:hypothetical protein
LGSSDEVERLAKSVDERVEKFVEGETKGDERK